MFTLWFHCCVQWPVMQSLIEQTREMLEEMEADNTLCGKSLDVVDTVWLSSEIGSITPKTIAARSIYVASRSRV
jgi:hypothetical protein